MEVGDFEHLALWFNQKFYLNTNSSPLAPLLAETDICANRVFCRKFNSEQLLLEPFFLYTVDIFAIIQP